MGKYDKPVYTPIPTKEKATENTPGTTSVNSATEQDVPADLDSSPADSLPEPLSNPLAAALPFDGVTSDEVPDAQSSVGNLETAKEFIILVNRNRIAITVNGVDGDSILVPPGEHLVPGHFNWNLPSGIKVKEV